MYYSLSEIFAIGVGPSSSHTVGPMRAAKRYIDNLRAQGVFDKINRLEATLYGSLALTGEGHGTIKAIVYGFMGLEAEEIDPEKPYVVAVGKDKVLHLGQKRPIAFDLQKDVIFEKEIFLPEHSNGMRFKAFDEQGNLLLEEVYFSVGGGTIARSDEVNRRVEREAYKIPYDYNNCNELMKLCEEHNMEISDLVWANEVAIHGEAKVNEHLEKIHRVMQASIERGMNATGALPGELKMQRKAREIYLRLEEKFRNNDYDPLLMVDWINLWGFAVAEENASGGQIVTAPTMGSAGVMPAVIRYYERFAVHKSGFTPQEGIKKFFLTASGICSLYRSNASISGAEVGCQGEVGVACSMAAAGLTAAMGGTNLQIENAAEIAMEHNLGLTCDPIGGLVQVPCIERNAMGAVKAVNSARIAMKGDGTHIVSLDSVIKTMYDTGNDMHNKYKETSLGGLALNVC